LIRLRQSMESSGKLSWNSTAL